MSLSIFHNVYHLENNIYLFPLPQQGQCTFNRDYAIANISEWSIMPKNEDALAFALWKVGPIPVSINAAPKSFQLYR